MASMKTSFVNLTTCERRVGREPFAAWLITLVIVLALFSLTTGAVVVRGIKTDSTGLSLIIVVTFGISVTLSFLHALRLRTEWKALNAAFDHVPDATSSYEGEVGLLLGGIRAAEFKAPASTKSKELVESYYARVSASSHTLAMLSGMMITLGMVGTLIGLILSVGGLEQVITSVGNAREELLGGMKETVRGMGIAFYCTLIGAILGGVILKLLSVNLNGSAVRLACGLLEFIELTFLPVIREQIRQLHRTAGYSGSDDGLSAMSDAMTTIMIRLKSNFDALSSSISNTERELSSLAKTSLNSRRAEIASHLSNCANELIRFSEERPPAVPTRLKDDPR